MITLAEIARWIVYRVEPSLLPGRGRSLMRRDKLLLGSERKFRALLEAAPDAIVIVDWHGHIALVNAETERLFGYGRKRDPGAAASRSWFPRACASQHRQHIKGFTKDPHARADGGRTQELLGRRKDGTTFPVEISLSPLETDEGLLVSAVIRDVTERKQDEERLRYLADHDSLTGLVNRRSFEEQLARELAVARRYQRDGNHAPDRHRRPEGRERHPRARPGRRAPASHRGADRSAGRARPTSSAASAATSSRS